MLCRSLKLGWKHLYQALGLRTRNLPIAHAAYFAAGPATLQYPREQLPVPTRGRYQLQNVMEDCILCDKCARVCPVDCIEIEAVKAPAPIGKTSNGVPKPLTATRFMIDMAKCCFCGLCTTVCPTQCLTMNSAYDYSVLDRTAHQLNFTTTPLKKTSHTSKKT
mmetsp:Transcript_17116/g.39580  ORF Transcript_17116/g.39580 Transcript_17116/m.39580 type:complete len:163 (-) Transcript_17116:2607-3095(-)